LLIAVIFAVVGFAIVIPLALLLRSMTPAAPVAIATPVDTPLPTMTPAPSSTPSLKQMNAAECAKNPPQSRHSAVCFDGEMVAGITDVICSGHGGVKTWLVCPSAPVPTPTQPPGFADNPLDSPVTVNVGETASNSIESITVLGVRRLREFGKYDVAPAGKIYIVLDVVIQSVGKVAATYNPWNFKVKDSGGYEYNISFSAPDPALSSGDLYNGDKVRGNVAFLVPESATGLVAAYSMNIFGVSAYINLGL